MKSFSVLPLLFLAFSLQAQVAFDDYFTDRTMRFDFMMAGNSTTTKVYPVSFREEPFWEHPASHLNRCAFRMRMAWIRLKP